MSDQAHSPAIFTSDKSGPRRRAWYAMTEEEQRATDAAGMVAIAEWEGKHCDSIVHGGGALGPTKPLTQEGLTDMVDLLTVFTVVRASSHDAAARLFEGHSYMAKRLCGGGATPVFGR